LPGDRVSAALEKFHHGILISLADLSPFDRSRTDRRPKAC